MNEQQIWRHVYEALMEDPIHRGKYDAVNGDRVYMFGVCRVMERIACKADKEDDFYKEFFGNIDDSEAKAAGK